MSTVVGYALAAAVAGALWTYLRDMRRTRQARRRPQPPRRRPRGYRRAQVPPEVTTGACRRCGGQE